MKNRDVKLYILIIGIFLISSLLLSCSILLRNRNILNVRIDNKSSEKYNSISIYEKGGDKEHGITSDLLPGAQNEAEIKLNSTLSESAIYMKYRKNTGEEIEVCLLGYIENGVGGTVNVEFEENEEISITN